jgi:two-component system, response regulator PdtaR
MDGLKLAQAVRNRWPPVHIIATSAYHATLVDELPTGSVFLPKPYNERKIIGTLHALAGAHQ